MAITKKQWRLLHQILPRLSAKSVARFMCVSKELHSFLSSETFNKKYMGHDKFLFLINDYKEPRTLGTIDCEAPNYDVSTFKLPMESKSVKFLTSFDGLVCASISYTIYSHGDLILWNPLTGDWKMLPYKPMEHNLGSLGLFYSSCEDDYKLVSVSCCRNIVKIYSLKSDSWKTVAFKGISDLKNYRLSQGTFLNEYLYFLNENKRYSVVRYGTKTQTFVEMNTSDFNADIDHYSALLMIKNGCIHVCITYESYVGKVCFEIELWKIDKEGNWKKMKIFSGRYGLYALYEATAFDEEWKFVDARYQI